jgi:hypothetical protein
MRDDEEVHALLLLLLLLLLRASGERSLVAEAGESWTCCFGLAES